MTPRKALLLLLACLHATSLAAPPKERAWIVLPDGVRPYLAPDLQGRRTQKALRFGREVQGTAFAGTSQGIRWFVFSSERGDRYLPLAHVVLKTNPPKGPDGNLSLGREKVDRATPLPLDYKPNDLVTLDKKRRFAAEGNPLRLRREAARATERMLAAAREEKVHLRLVSAFRSARTQRRLYLNKLAKAGLSQKLVAKPGHSEHQLGTTIDVCGLDPKTVLKAEWARTVEGRWLRDNAPRFGFRVSYTPENAAQTGYAPEPWHIRYMGDAAKSER